MILMNDFLNDILFEIIFLILFFSMGSIYSMIKFLGAAMIEKKYSVFVTTDNTFSCVLS